MIDRSTPWRSINDIPMETWQRTIGNAGGPDGLVRPEAWASARPHSALCLAQLAKESSYGVNWDANRVESKNALNLKDRINGGYVQAATWEAGVAAWRARITDPTYPNGLALYAKTTTLAEYVYVFAPPNDQTKTTTEAYLNAIISLMNSWGPVSVPAGEDEIPMAETITFGRVPDPPYIDMIVRKDRPGQGYDVCPPRHNIGFVPHETQGDPPGEGIAELQWYRDFFSCPNGERCHNALVDWTCARDGTAARFNDPNGTREPWASGGAPNTNDPSGFNRFFGSSKRNEILESCEFIKLDNDRMTAAQIAWGAARAAYIADQDGQLWSEYPRPQKYGGTHMMPEHRQVSLTTCGQHPDDLSGMIAQAKAIMRKHQGGADTGTTPAPSIYAEPVPIPELHLLKDADPNAVIAITAAEGTEFIFVNDRVRAIRDTPRLQRAAEKSKVIGPTIPAGSEFTVSWLFTAKDGRAYYLTPFWTRAKVSDTERVKDAV